MFKQFRGSIFILISALMFGAYGLLSRGIEQYDVFFQTYVRCLLISIVLVAFGIARQSFKRIEKEDYRWFAVVIGFTIFSIAPIVYAYKYLTLGTASFLFYGALTVFTYILGFAFFKEKLTKMKALVLGLSALGLILIFAGSFGAALLLPALMALFNGVASSGEVVFSKKISDKYSNVQITSLIFLAITVTHFVLSIGLGETQDFTLVTDHTLNLLAFAAASIIGMYTVIEGYKHIEPSIGAIIGLTEIVFSLFLGIIFFAEVATPQTVVGGLLIIIAAALPNVVELYRKRKSLNLG